MKKNHLLIAVFVLLLNINCKKNDDQNSFQSFLKFKLDNVLVECTSRIQASVSPTGPDEYISISGYWADGSIELILNEAGRGELKPGTYIFLPTTGRSGELWLPNTYFSGLGGGAFDPLVGGSGQITITEISPEYVKGSFDCVLIDIIPTAKKILTDGVPYQKRILNYECLKVCFIQTAFDIMHGVIPG